MNTLEEGIVLNALVLYQAILSISCAYLLHVDNERENRRRRHKWWVKPLIRKREYEGTTKILLAKNPSDGFYHENFLRLSREDFNFLLEKISSDLQTSDTRCRRAITPSEKLAVTLRFLATGTIYLFYITVILITFATVYVT
jgi:hypothetical protein